MKAAAFAVLLALGATNAPSAATAAKTAAITVSFLEPAGRIKIGEQKLDLALDAKAHETALTLGGSLEGYKLRTLAREVKVTSATGTAAGLFCELTILGRDGAEAGYLSLTLPAEAAPVFSASTKFKGAKGSPLLAVVTR